MTGETVDATDPLLQSEASSSALRLERESVGLSHDTKRRGVEPTDPNSMEVFREAFKGLTMNAETTTIP